ncbi:MAG TPA: hypothetical protein VGE66_20920 [Chitinophagaceae bacterium]
MESIYVLFHDRAGEAMHSLYRSFRKAVAPIDRQGGDNVFRHQQSLYTEQLKRRLESIALELLSKLNKSVDPNECHHTLSRFIQDYVREFGQKIRAL